MNECPNPCIKNDFISFHKSKVLYSLFGVVYEKRSEKAVNRVDIAI